MLGPAREIIWANSAWGRELSLDSDDLIGAQICDLAHPDDRGRFALELIDLREQGHSNFECRMLGDSGGVTWVRWHGAQDPGGLILSGRDVTALREPDRGRTDLLNSALDAIVSIDADDRIVEFNPSAERSFGFSREQALGRSLSELIVPPAHREAHREGVRRVASGTPFKLIGKRLELNAMHADGSEFPVELTITQTSTDPLRVTAFVRDLTSERAARSALSESEARYESAFDQAPMGIALISLDLATPGRLMRVNDALSRMTGYGEDDLLAGTFSDFTHPDDIETNKRLFAEVLAGTRLSYELEKRFIRRDGSVMWASVHGSVARNADGPMYGIGQVQDITERKEAEAALRLSEHRLERTERLAQIGSWEWDLVPDRLSWSVGLNDIFGSFDPAAPPPLEAFLSLVHGEDRAHVRQIMNEAVEGHPTKSWEFRISRGDSVSYMYAWGEVALGENGTPRAIHGYAQDVTHRRRAEQRAEGLRRDNELILDAAGDGIFRVDEEGVTTYVNPTAARLLGYSPSDLLGEHIHPLVHHSRPDGTPHPPQECPVTLAAKGGPAQRVVDDVLWRRDGTAMPVDYTSAPIQEGGEASGAVVVFRDVTERQQMEARLRIFAEVDALTGLMNRRRFEESLAELLADRRGNGGALLLLDLDHFKFVNDSFGHAAGDNLIRAVAAVLRQQVRDEDVLARLGGDEFALLLPGADVAATAAAANRLVAAIEEARPTGLEIGASIGVTRFEAKADVRAGDLLVSADIALYEAKEKGRGRVEFFKGQPGRSLTWVERIRTALEDDRFILHSQPIINLLTGGVEQEELLVRMVDESGTMIPPGQFLPTAEAFGLIRDIDRWVVEAGVHAAAAGHCVHINLSGRSIGSRVLLEELTRLVLTLEADPGNLVFEITETSAVANLADARLFADHLHRLGCRIALDDFGTGFGSLTYLRTLPTDFLKIDMDFVRGLADSEEDLRVVEAVVDIAARFGQRTVAEGVEDEGALQVLRTAGVDFAQGYHLGRPALLECAMPSSDGDANSKSAEINAAGTIDPVARQV